MIYNNATFMGISWKVIINSFKDYIKDKPQDSLKDYVQTFVKYLAFMNIYTRNAEIEMVKKYATFMVGSLHTFMNDEAIEKLEDVKKWFSCRKNLYDSEKMLQLDKPKFLSEFKEAILEVFKAEYDCLSIFDDEFVDVVYSYVCSSDLIAKIFTGVVFAGYGSKELFSSLMHLCFDGEYCGEIKYKKILERSGELSKENHTSASIIPIAQHDITYSILNGISQDLENLRLEEQSQIKKQLADVAAKYLDKQDKVDMFNKILSNLLEQHNVQFELQIKKYYSEPFVDMIQTLSIHEMGEMARTLVSVTAFRKIQVGCQL